MKKYILIVFLATITHSIQAQERIVTIGILTDESSESSRPLLSELENEIKAVVGQSATVVFKTPLENRYSIIKAKKNYQELLKSSDIILAFGVINAIAIYQEEIHAKPTVVFGAINRDLIQLPENQKTSETNNVTYIITPSSYSNDLRSFKELYDYKNIGIVVDEFLIETLPIKKLFDDYFSRDESTYKLISFNKGGDMANSIDGLDAIYLAGGFHLDSVEFKKMVNSINQQKLPSFSSLSKKDVERGILATNQPEDNIEQFFRRIALNVEAIIDGTNPSELPLYIEYKDNLSINYNTAEMIDFPISYSLLGTANFIGGKVNSNTANTYSLVNIMKGVIDKNLSLGSEKASVMLTEEDVRTAKSNYLPNVSVQANGVYLDPKVAEIANGQNPELSTSGKATVEQLIYSESASAGIDIQKSVNKAQKEVYNAAELDAILNASQAYFNALILQTNVRIQNKNLQLTKRNLELSEQNFKAGATGKSDVLRFRSQLAQNMQGLIDADNQLKQAYYTINQLLNNNISTKIAIENAEIEVGIFKNYEYTNLEKLLDNPRIRPILADFLVEEAKKNAPEIKNLNYNLEAIQRNYRLNDKGRFVPTVALQGNYNLALSESGVGSEIPLGVPTAPDGNYNVGLNVSLPIFQQNQRNINRQIARIQKDQLEIQQDNVALNIEKNINDILLDLISQIANIEISKISEETAKESLDLTQNAYKEGAVPIIQLIDAQNNYLQSQLASATANYQYLLTSMQLERALGYFFLLNSTSDNKAFIQRANQYILNKN